MKIFLYPTRNDWMNTDQCKINAMPKCVSGWKRTQQYDLHSTPMRFVIRTTCVYTQPPRALKKILRRTICTSAWRKINSEAWGQCTGAGHYLTEVGGGAGAKLRRGWYGLMSDGCRSMSAWWKVRSENVFYLNKVNNKFILVVSWDVSDRDQDIEPPRRDRDQDMDPPRRDRDQDTDPSRPRRDTRHNLVSRDKTLSRDTQHCILTIHPSIIWF